MIRDFSFYGTCDVAIFIANYAISLTVNVTKIKYYTLEDLILKNEV